MGYFNSNKNRIAVNSRGNRRSYQGQNRRIIQSMIYDDRTQSNKYVEQEVYLTKKQAEAIDLGFTAYSIKYGDIMLIADPRYMLPIENIQDHHIVKNKVFENIRADKIALIYSPKWKQFLFVVLNNDYSIYVLERLDQCPNHIDLDNLHPNIEIKEHSNRLIVSVYYESEVLDLTYNPVLNYGIMEVFKK